MRVVAEVRDEKVVRELHAQKIAGYAKEKVGEGQPEHGTHGVVQQDGPQPPQEAEPQVVEAQTVGAAQLMRA